MLNKQPERSTSIYKYMPKFSMSLHTVC